MNQKAYETKCTYFKLVKLDDNGSKIGYYNSSIDPESNWPTKNVDEAQILTAEEVQGVKALYRIIDKHTNSKTVIHEIGIY
jgi:hypothetical protein